MIERRDLREVVGHQPHLARHHWVKGEDHDSLPRHPKHLGQPGLLILPVVERQDGHGGVDAVVGEWKGFGATDRGRGKRGITLRDHQFRRLDRSNVAACRFVGPTPRADVDD